MQKNIELKEFLKKYTAIPNKFIDEYYKFYEMCEYTMFGINGDAIVKYLSLVEVKKFYKRIRNNYELNVDYIIKRTETDSINSLKNSYYFTFDCFEKLCMLSNTSKGVAVRDYFIILRKFVNYYCNHIADKIDELVDSGKYIYIILVNKNKNIFKIGMTKDMRKRLSTYATGKDTHPDIYFIMVVNDPHIVEKCIKLFTKNKQYKVGKELYKVDYDVLKSFAFDCAVMDQKAANKVLKGSKKYDAYIVYDESKSDIYLDAKNNVIGYEKKLSKKTSRKISQKVNRKLSKRTSRKTSKKTSHKVNRKLSKKTSRKMSRKVNHKLSKRQVRK